MIVYIIICLLLTLAYVFLFIFYLAGWLLHPEFKPDEKIPSTKCSIIVPARNEEQRIGALLNDLVSQEYPDHLFEVIVVDDFSEDNTTKIVLSFSKASLLHLNDIAGDQQTGLSYKKKALEYGIKNATGDLIITTDADCSMNSVWLKTLVNYYEAMNCHMIVAPVLFNGDGNFFEKLQSLDYSGLIGITGASLYFDFAVMCNGANLAFSKKSFEEVNGYEGIDHVPSGDDMLLMHKIASRWKRGVRFLKNKNAAVYTPPCQTMKEFFDQRIRWTSKSRYYTDKRIILNLVMVYLFNLSLLLNLIGAFFSSELLYLFYFQFILKIIVELSFLSEVTKYFNRQKLLWLILPGQLFHIIYIVSVGTLGNFIKTTWKGRKIS